MFSLLKINKIENAIPATASSVRLLDVVLPGYQLNEKRKGMYLSCVCLMLWLLCWWQSAELVKSPARCLSPALLLGPLGCGLGLMPDPSPGCWDPGLGLSAAPRAPWVPLELNPSLALNAA